MDDELFELFLEETRENLQVMEEGLLDLEGNTDNIDLINVIFRAMHTIKGGAGLVGMQRINDVTHRLENLLDGVRNQEVSLTDDVFKVLFDGTDIIKKMLDENDFTGVQFSEAIDTLFKQLDYFDQNHTTGTDSTVINNDNKTVNNAENEKSKSEIRTFKITLRFQPTIFESGTDPLMILREIQEVGRIVESYCNSSKLPLLEELVTHQFYLEWTVFVETDKNQDAIDEIFIFVADDNEIFVDDVTEERALSVEYTLSEQKQIGELLVDEGKVFKQEVNKIVNKQEEAKNQEHSSTIRVEASKLEGILNHLAELLISHSRVKELVLSNMNLFNDRSGEQHNNTINREINTAFEEVDKIIRIVQEKVMNTSMIPIGGTFTRYQRMIRDLARDINKEVKIHIEGKETELDKQVIEQIADPLKHLIRNALDHGIETPDEREAMDKPREGTITLRAFHQEGNIVIQISDDGKGIDEQAIFAKAVEKQIVRADDKLSKQDMYLLLFNPGFSTAKQVTDISGRGVGLDVVMTNIKNLRGTVEIDSEIGKGTTITIKLPLTLAIIDGMMVRVGQERFIIPLNMISEFIKASPEQVHQAEGNGAFIHLRGENLPYVGLYDLLDLDADCHAPTEGILVVLQHNGRKLALMVDDILGQQQVVIKSLKENMQQQIDGIAGVTILGNGMVAIILDVPTIYKMVKQPKSLRSSAG